jgi:hypothetical protein
MESAPEKGAKQRWIEIAKRVVPLLLTIMIPMAGGLWAVYVFLENQRELAAKREVEIHSQARTRFLELQKPLIDQQFATYNEFIRVIGDLLATDVTEVAGSSGDAASRIIGSYTGAELPWWRTTRFTNPKDVSQKRCASTRKTFWHAIGSLIS